MSKAKPLQAEIAQLRTCLKTIAAKAGIVLYQELEARNLNVEYLVSKAPLEPMRAVQEQAELFDTICDQIYFTLEQSKRILEVERYQLQQLEAKKGEISVILEAGDAMSLDVDGLEEEERARREGEERERVERMRRTLFGVPDEVDEDIVKMEF